MNIWTEERWKENIDQNIPKHRTGLRFRFDATTHPEVRRACLEYGKWLRKNYVFPVRVPVYVRDVARLKCLDGDWAYSTFFCPDDYKQEPYIRVAAGDYRSLLQRWGKDEALAAYLLDITRSLTFYFQWINGACLTDTGKSRQATVYSRRILGEYARTRANHNKQGL